MKRVLLSTFVLAASMALGADLKLSDGREFRDFTITSQTPTTVLVRHVKGMAKIDKRLLPPDLLKKYPIEEKAAAAEAEDIARGKALYEEQARAASAKEREEMATRKAASDKRRLEQEQIQTEVARIRASDAVGAKVAAARADDALPERVKEAVRERAEEYFKTERIAPSSTLTIEIKTVLDEPEALAGWPGRFNVVGRSSWQLYHSNGSSFSSGSSWFRCDVWQKPNGSLQVRDFAALHSEPIR